MYLPDNITTYEPREERINIISHGIGFVLSIVGLVLLMHKSLGQGNFIIQVSVAVFGASMILLYLASTLYHSATHEKWRHRLNIFDHASIYVLIAGTYTPFSLVTLTGRVGWTIFGVIWTFAIVGVILKLFYTGRYQVLSTVMYVFMGWVIVFAISPLLLSLSSEGLMWLLAGGLSYTLGAVLFSMERLRFNHAIFHIFVLIGTFCHFISIYNHVL